MNKNKWIYYNCKVGWVVISRDSVTANKSFYSQKKLILTWNKVKQDNDHIIMDKLR